MVAAEQKMRSRFGFLVNFNYFNAHGKFSGGDKVQNAMTIEMVCI